MLRNMFPVQTNKIEHICLRLCLNNNLRVSKKFFKVTPTDEVPSDVEKDLMDKVLPLPVDPKSTIDKIGGTTPHYPWIDAQAATVGLPTPSRCPSRSLAVNPTRVCDPPTATAASHYADEPPAPRHSLGLGDYYWCLLSDLPRKSDWDRCASPQKSHTRGNLHRVHLQF